MIFIGYVIDNKELMDLWDVEKNNESGISPDTLKEYSHQSAWWRCQNGHTYQMVIYSKREGRDCPYCTNRKVLEGYNDILTTHPEIAKQWDYDSNGDLLPTMISHGSDRIVFWVCEYGHKWQQRVAARTRGSACPVCNMENSCSLKELKVFYYIKKYFKDTVLCYSNNDVGLTEIDIYIPSLRIGIEYDGQAWHKDTCRDKSKDNICQELNIKLFRIREPECPKYTSSCVFMHLDNLDDVALSTIIINILETLGIKHPHVDFDKDMREITELMFYKRKDNSLAEKYPNIAEEWHKTKNGHLTPHNVYYGSVKQVWWACSVCGHEWATTVNGRTNNGRGCPNCAKKRKMRAIYCPELNKIFSSLKDAADETGVKYQNISRCLRKDRKHAGRHPLTNEKLSWYYMEDQIVQDGSIILGAISLGYVANKK